MRGSLPTKFIGAKAKRRELFDLLDLDGGRRRHFSFPPMKVTPVKEKIKRVVSTDPIKLTKRRARDEIEGGHRARSPCLCPPKKKGASDARIPVLFTLIF